MNETLKNAIVRAVGGRQYLEDVYHHGADAGFPNFTYLSDTTRFFRRHRREIVELAEETARDMGESVLDMIASFPCLHSDVSTDEIARVLYGQWHDDDTHVMVANAMAWFALEAVARHVCES